MDKDRQLAVYAYGVKKMYPDAKKIRLIWHYLAFDKELTSQRSDEELEELRHQTLELIKDIEKTKEFPPTQSALCDWCEFRPECPLFKHLYKLEKTLDNEYLEDDGVKLVNKYSEVYEDIKHKEEELEKIKEALLEFAKREGAEIVYGSDVKATIKEYPRLSFPKKEDPRREDFIDTVKKIGLWEKLASVDVYELAKMINNKELPEELIKVLDSYIEKGTNTRVYLRRK